MTERTCIVTRQTAEPDDLIRFVRSPVDGQVVPDLTGNLPGRGVWVGNSCDKVSKAIERKLFERGFRQNCTTPDGLAALVAQQLDGLALGYLSLARKAGEAVQGFDKVEAQIAQGRTGVLISACDGAEDGRNKLLRRLRSAQPEATVIDFFSSDQLGLALGRTNVIHAAIAKGGLARKFASAAKRVQSYRGDCGTGTLETKVQA